MIINIHSPGYYDHPVAISLKMNELKDIGKQRLIRYPIYIDALVLDVNTGEVMKSKEVDIQLFPSEIDSQYPRLDGRKILTVCEYLKMRADYPLVYTRWDVIIIGNLIQTSEGSWLQQSCGNTVKSDVHSWPDAIFLGKDSTIRQYESIFIKAENRFWKDLIQKSSSDDNIVVAVMGKLTTSDNLTYVKCGKEKTCGFGYGPIATPAQIEYVYIHYLNQDDIGKK